jgi:hypothetical protein
LLVIQKNIPNLNEIITYAKDYLKVLEDLKSTKKYFRGQIH